MCYDVRFINVLLVCKKVFLSISLSLSFVCFAFLAKVVRILYSGGNNSALLLLALSFFSLFLQFFFEKSNMRRVLLSSSQFNSRPRLPPQSLALSKTGRTPCPLSSTARLPVTLCSTVNARSRINSSLCKKSSSIAKQTSTSPVLANRCLHFGLPRTSCYALSRRLLPFSLSLPSCLLFFHPQRDIQSKASLLFWEAR